MTKWSRRLRLKRFLRKGRPWRQRKIPERWKSKRSLQRGMCRLREREQLHRVQSRKGSRTQRTCRGREVKRDGDSGCG